ncbi:MAG: dihydrofolate reductase [Bacteroidetes bacterium]|nr:MAG: dihydrofolate reductase [Bacteroidota bacterium]
MNNNWIYAFAVSGALVGCNPAEQSPSSTMEAQHDDSFQWQLEQFEDLRILRYQVPGFDKLSTQQKMLVYHLTEAGLAGRDIIYATNYRHNLEIRHIIDDIMANHNSDEASSEWEAFQVYAKRVWFSNGIHHHYSNQKFEPGFSEEFFNSLLEERGLSISAEARRAIFDPTYDAKKVSKDPNSDLLLASAVNFYDPDVTEEEVVNFYKEKSAGDPERPISLGLNSKIVRNEDGTLSEAVYKVDGLYGDAISKVVGHLSEAVKYAENEAQAQALELLIEYYQTGDLAKWDEYNIAWVNATEGDIDYINGFIEVYNDPLGYRGSYETIVQVRDFEASERMAVVSSAAQWFEDNSPIMDEHKKAEVKGISYRIINVAGEAGDASPSTPIGVNLPNANWIRAEHGSKSVSLGNIEMAYEQATGEGFLKEFAFSTEEREIAEKYGEMGSKLHTALHEVIGHASGRLNPGVGTPKETLKNYSSTLEEARADLVALYYIMDPHLIEMGLVENDGPGKAEYNSYIRNGMMLQLRRLKPGENLEEDHMRNRQLVASWAYEMGKEENVIERKVVDGKTYFVINNYERLRELFGELLREIQRIKSEGDYTAGRALVENYGVKVDHELHREVLVRAEALNIAPYSGFVNPILTPVMENGEAVDVELSYPASFAEQMLEYAAKYGVL